MTNIDDIEPKVFGPLGDVEVIEILNNDHSYVYGKMSIVNFGPFNGGYRNYMCYLKKAEKSDPEYSYTRYYFKESVFVVMESESRGGHASDRIIRILKTYPYSKNYERWEYNKGHLTRYIKGGINSTYEKIEHLILDYKDDVVDTVEVTRGCNKDYYLTKEESKRLVGTKVTDKSNYPTLFLEEKFKIFIG